MAVDRFSLSSSSSSFSAKVNIRNRNNTDNTVSPCLTPMIYSTVTSYLLIFNITFRLVYTLLIVDMNLARAPSHFKQFMRRLWLAVSKAFAKSTKVTYVIGCLVFVCVAMILK